MNLYAINWIYLVSFGSACTWTPFFNSGTPSSTGEYETLHEIRSKYPEVVCGSPVNIDVRLSDDRLYTESGDVVLTNPTFGMVCLNAHQTDKQCKDYKIRFCCDAYSTSPSITTMMATTHSTIADPSLFPRETTVVTPILPVTLGPNTVPPDTITSTLISIRPVTSDPNTASLDTTVVSPMLSDTSHSDIVSPDTTVVTSILHVTSDPNTASLDTTVVSPMLHDTSHSDIVSPDTTVVTPIISVTSDPNIAPSDTTVVSSILPDPLHSNIESPDTTVLTSIRLATPEQNISLTSATSTINSDTLDFKPLVSATSTYNATHVTSTEFSIQIQPVATTKPGCECFCYVTDNLLALDGSLIQEIKNNLTLETKTLSRQRRSKTSAPDNRPSAVLTGYIGLIIILLVTTFLVSMDFLRMMSYLYYQFHEMKARA